MPIQVLTQVLTQVQMQANRVLIICTDGFPRVIWIRSQLNCIQTHLYKRILYLLLIHSFAVVHPYLHNKKHLERAKKKKCMIKRIGHGRSFLQNGIERTKKLRGKIRKKNKQRRNKIKRIGHGRSFLQNGIERTKKFRSKIRKKNKQRRNKSRQMLNSKRKRKKKKKKMK